MGNALKLKRKEKKLKPELNKLDDTVREGMVLQEAERICENNKWVLRIVNAYKNMEGAEAYVAKVDATEQKNPIRLTVAVKDGIVTRVFGFG